MVEFSGSFRVRDAIAQGVSPGALRATHLSMPFQGVRSVEPPGDITALCRAYATKMRSDAAFTGVTAALLWGMPLPASVDARAVDVATPHGTARAMGRGVRGSQVDPARVEVVTLDGLRVLSPPHTWVSLGRVLALGDLVAAADFLVTAPFGSTTPALATVDALHRTLRGLRGPGLPLLRHAARLALPGPLSRPESLSRVLFVSAGIPTPVANFRVSPLITLDEAWESVRFGFEYLGDQHRSPSQFSRDVRRRELIAEHGWGVLEATKDDLFGHPHELVARLRSRLSERGLALRPVHPSKFVLPRP